MRASARALRAEYAIQEIDLPEWLPQRESDLDTEIQSRKHLERLRRLWELGKEHIADQAVEDQ